MKPKPGVFVSFASEDKDAVVVFCNDLEEYEIDVWVSFRDIKPGDEWSIAIEEAMNAATHVIVVVSKASVASEYVRAEVEFALKKQKTVIPIMIENVEFPLRWQALQYVDLTNESTKSRGIANLAALLPKNTKAQLAALLAGDNVEKVQEFIRGHSFLFQIGREDAIVCSCFRVPRFLDKYRDFTKEFTQYYEDVSNSIVRCSYRLLAIARLGDIEKGWTKQLVMVTYLLDHRNHPFNEDGTLGNELHICAEDFYQAQQVLEDAHCEQIILGLRIIAGQRPHYSKKIIDMRQSASLAIEARGRAMQPNTIVSISSYTNLLNKPYVLDIDS